MGKIKNRLEAQLEISEYTQDAKDCMLIYDYLIKEDDGHIWESRWSPLVSSTYVGKYPNGKTVYHPTDLGRALVVKIKQNNNTEQLLHYVDIEKACKWLEDNVKVNGAFYCFAFKQEDIELFRKAMLEEE